MRLKATSSQGVIPSATGASLLSGLWGSKKVLRTRAGNQKRSPDPMDLGLSLWLAVGAYFLLQNLPIASVIAMPVVYLGTLAHELGHCVAGELLATQCSRIELRPNGGGTAYIFGISSVSSSAVIYAAGFIGPSLVGAVILIMSRRFGLSRAALLGLSLVLAWTAIEWGQDIFTDAVTWSYSGLFVLLALLSGAFLRAIIAQFFAIVFAVQTVEGWGYAMISGFSRDGIHMVSDTGKLAELLGGTHQFWGTVVMGIAVAILVLAFLLSGRR